MIDRLLILIDRVCLAAAVLAAAMLAALFLLGLTELLLRNIFSVSLSYSIEYSGYLVALSLLTGSGHALNQGAHVRVSLLQDRLSPSLARSLDLAATAIALVVAVFLAAALARYAMGTALRGTLSYFPSQTPLAIPQMLLTIGPMTLVLALFARVLRLVSGHDLEGATP